MSTQPDGIGVRLARHAVALVAVAAIAATWLVAAIAVALPDPITAAMSTGRLLAATFGPLGPVIGGSALLPVLIVTALALTERETQSPEEDR